MPRPCIDDPRQKVPLPSRHSSHGRTSFSLMQTPSLQLHPLAAPHASLMLWNERRTVRAICAAEVLLHTLPSARLLPCSLRGGSSVLPRTHAGQRDASGPRRASRLDRHPRRAPVSFLQTPAPWPPRHRSELFPSPSSPDVARGQAQGNRKPRRESVKETPSSRIPAPKPCEPWPSGQAPFGWRDARRTLRQ